MISSDANGENPRVRDGRLTVGVIGDEDAGAVLALALAAAGHQLIGHTPIEQQATNQEQVEDELLGAVEKKSSRDLFESADLVLLNIAADRISAFIDQATENAWWRSGQLVIHLNGRFGHGLLAEAARAGVIPIAIHPALQFTGTSLDLAQIRESYFAVSAPNVALPIAQALVIEMGAEPIVIEEDSRQQYFEAFEVASGFSAMVVNQAIGRLEAAGVENARAVIAPVVRTAVERALAEGHRPLDPEELLE